MATKRRHVKKNRTKRRGGLSAWGEKRVPKVVAAPNLLRIPLTKKPSKSLFNYIRGDKKTPVAAPVSNVKAPAEEFKSPVEEFKAPTEQDQEAKMEALSNEYNKDSALKNKIYKNRESLFGKNNGNLFSVKSKNNLSDEEIKQFTNSIEPKLKTKANTQRIKNALNKVVDAKMVNSMKQRFTKKNIWEN